MTDPINKGELKLQEFYRRHRPKELADVLGQPEAVATLSKMLDKGSVPHAMLITGPSGTGKTTLARILRKKIGCSLHDFKEINIAESRGIDTVREIQNSVNLAPINGKTRAWCLDEIHRATGDAQSALLKILEDGPNHAYFFLCTTDPQKLLPTIKTRCSQIRLQALPADKIEKLIRETAGKEKGKVSDKVVKLIVEVSDGSARKAMVLLSDVWDMPEQEQINVIQKEDIKKQAIDLARALIDKKGGWEKCSSILKNLEETDYEGVRRMIRSYAQSILFGEAKHLHARSALILECFGQLVYDKAELTRASWEVFNG